MCVTDSASVRGASVDWLKMCGEIYYVKKANVITRYLFGINKRF